jgi:GAF domain-containing protein
MGTLSTYMPEAIDRALPDFASRDPDAYTTADREFMVVDGRQVAIAVENALAFEEDDKLRKKLEQLRILVVRFSLSELAIMRESRMTLRDTLQVLSEGAFKHKEPDPRACCSVV